MLFYLFLILPLLAVNANAKLHERFEEWVEKFAYRFEHDEHRQYVLSNW